jgi:predicted site-specific integrase-resolvase
MGYATLMPRLRPRLLKPGVVAEQLEVSEQTLARWRVSGKGPRFVKLANGRIRYDQAEIDAEIEARVRCSTSDVVRPS